MKKRILFFTGVVLLFAGSGCYKKETIPVADFSFVGTSDSLVPDTVTFHNLSQNAYSYNWDFGDSHSSSDNNPVHIYIAAGKFTITLKAYSSSGKEWAIKTGTLILSTKKRQH